MRAGDIMTTNVRFVAPGDSLETVIGAMHDDDIRHIPVIDDGELVGIVSDRDIRATHLALASLDTVQAARASLQRPVSEIMTGSVHTVSPEDDLSEVVMTMLEHRVGALPVVDEETRNLEGIVSYIDVLRHVVDLV